MSKHDENCDSNKNGWLKRNLTLQTILTLAFLLGGLLIAGYTFIGKVDKGVQAATRVEVIEKDYVGKEEFKGHINTIHGKIGKLETKIDRLTGAILKRLPGDDDE